MKLYCIYRACAHISCFIYNKEYLASKALQDHLYLNLLHSPDFLLQTKTIVSIKFSSGRKKILSRVHCK